MASRILLMSLLSALSFGQEIPALVVTPSSATILLGDSRAFRAVDATGMADTTVRWDAGSSDAEVRADGAEASFYFSAPGQYVVHAYGAGGSASAQVTVIRAFAYARGATKWTVESFEGCKTRRPVPAIPAPGSSNDVFMVDDCPRGTVVRALTAEGLENWRSWIAENGKVDFSKLSRYEPKSLLAASVCDNMKVGMTREEAIKMIASSKPTLADAERPKDVWMIEEGKSDCKVTFNEGHVTKKQKIINN
jgi:hypothetical protein